MIGEYLSLLIESAQESSIVPPPATIQSIFSNLLDPGKDFILPLLKEKGKEAVVEGTAMFHNRRFTGTLNVDQSILFTLLSGQNGKAARFSRKVNRGSPNNSANYIVIEVKKNQVKRKFKVTVRPDGRIDVNIDVKLLAAAMEYPQNQLSSEKEVKRLSKTLSKMLTQESQEVTRKMQKARCDAFGVGRQLIAFHPEVWKKKKWSQDYPKVHFNSKIKVEIIGSGILK
ncbi:Ger(x)C family spore germination C-terminal domain-containing protein [Ectobacillus panaciterrae]|uniref:Ger(x)C family spore germination C-terminal domain-containing protein n=1 Tax=Ectobacillus panaciterrae TaxID=363872 RepID=UPI000413AA2D|nr:Ger(x)C family spore germination C-terminal domain-containing protein [Ectobacillus panaciterrae]